MAPRSARDFRPAFHYPRFRGARFAAAWLALRTRLIPARAHYSRKWTYPTLRTLLPGAYAQVTFDAKLSGKRFSLPINALLFRPEGTMAAVVGPDHRLSLKKVTDWA